MANEATSTFQLPTGFRFHPSDQELIVYYLRNKVASLPLPASIVAEIDLYKYNPWELPNKALFGEDEWYFFSPRARKYPKGARPNRSARSGYWKATGTDKPILNSSGTNCIGVKKALVFYTGRPPNGIKTEWIMNEYRLLDTTIKTSMARGSMRLDDWVLCQIRQKGRISKNSSEIQERNNDRDLPWNIPEIEESCRACTLYKTDMIIDCLNKDCRLLASILAGQALPSIQTISSGSNQGSNKDNKRKRGNDSRFDDLLLSYKKLSSDGKGNEDLLAEDGLAFNDVNYYGHNQYQDIFYNLNRFDQISGFLELNELGFSSKYQQ